MDDKKLVTIGYFTEEELKGRKPLDVLEERLRENYSFNSIDDFDIIFSGVDNQNLRYEVYEKENEADKLNIELDELKKMRNAIDISDVEDREKLINVISTKLEKLEKETNNSSEIEDYINKEIKTITEELKKLEEEVKKEIEEYESFEEEMSNVIQEENNKLDSSMLLSSEELDNLKDASTNEKINISKKSITKKILIDLQRKKISVLKRKIKSLESDLKKAVALGLTVDEYKEITKTLKRKEILNNILSNKGLAPIVEKPAKERTKEEVKLLKEAKEDILREISEVQKADKKISVLEAIEALYNLDNILKKTRDPRKLPIEREKYEVMVASTRKLPEKIIGKSVVNYIPGKAPSDMENVVVNSGINEKIVIYSGSSKYFVKRPLIRRFNLKDIKEISYEDKPLFEISNEDYERIVNNSNNDVSPYSVEVEEIKLDKDNKDERTRLDEKIIMYSDGSKYFVKRPLIRRFNLKDIKEISYEDKPLFEISNEDYERIVSNSNNDVSPYSVEVEEIKLDKDNELENKAERTGLEEKILMYSDGSKYYVKRPLIRRFNLKDIKEISYEDKPLFEISNEDYERIVNNSNNDVSPFNVEVEEIKLDKDNELDKKDERTGLDEIITLYYDLNTNSYYVNRSLIRRFNLKDIGEEIVVNGKPLFMISDDDFKKINDNENNDYSPYSIEVDMTYFPTYIHDLGEPLIEFDDDPLEKIIFVFQDSTGKKYYVSKDVALDNNLKTVGAGSVNGLDCFEISVDDYHLFKIKMEDAGYTVDLIKVDKPIELRMVDENNNFLPVETVLDEAISNALDEEVDNKDTNNSEDNKTDEEIQETDTNTDKDDNSINVADNKTNTSNDLDLILSKLASDGTKKRYKATNVSASGPFIEELKNGGYSYNVVHFLGITAKASFNLLKLMTDKDYMSKNKTFIETEETFKDKLEKLSNEELNVLIEAFLKGNLKGKLSSENEAIVHEYIAPIVLSNVEQKYPNVYHGLMNSIGQIEVLNKELANNTISKKEREVFQERLSKLKKIASEYINDILILRNAVCKFDLRKLPNLRQDYPYTFLRDDLLRGLDESKKKDEEDLKSSLNDAFNNNNYDEILYYFMSLEKLYSKTSYDISESFLLLINDLNYKSDEFVEETMKEMAIKQAWLENANKELNNQVSSIDESKESKDIDLSTWKINSVYEGTNRYLEADNILFGFVLSRYEMEVLSEEDVLSEMSVLEDKRIDKMSTMGNKCLAVLEEYAKNNPSYPIDKVKKFIENLVRDADTFSFLSSECDQSIIDNLFKNYKEEISLIPRQMLLDILNISFSSSYVTAVNKTLESKYLNKNNTK